MKVLLTYIAVLFQVVLFAQNGWEECTLEQYTQAILASESNVNEGESYSFDSEYLFYTSLTINEAELTMQSSLICNEGKEIYLSQFGRLMYQNEIIKIVCDTADKKIVLSDPEPAFFKRRITSDFDLLLNSNCKVKKKESKLLSKYYFEFSKNPKYLAAEIWLSNLDMVKRYILYTSTEILDDSKEQERLIQPRLEVIFNNYKSGKLVEVQKMKTTEDFITIIDGAYSAHKDYKDFEIIDLRNSNN